MAQNLNCQTQGYCTNALECSPDTERFQVRDLGGDRAQFGWEGNLAFQAKAIRRDGIIVYIVTSSDTGVQMLTIAENLTATFAIVTTFGDQLYHSIQALNCAPA